MEQHDNPTDGPMAAETIADDTVPAPDPKRQFASPEMLMADESLSDAEKHALLQEWDLELDHRLNAEAEGMSASDPIKGRYEARMADEATRVKSCLNELNAKLGSQ